MKTKTLNYLRTKAFFILRVIRLILFNCLYYFGVIGLFVAWTFKLGIHDWQWWIQVLILGVLINVHRDIDKFVNR
jgi:hypothetical protein